MTNLKNLISKLGKAKILVIGDLILDEYIYGSVDRISPEAPVPVLWAKKRQFVPGGAANVAANIHSLGGEACLVGLIGADKNAEIFKADINKIGLNTKGVFVDSGRHTTVKTRIIAGHQQVVRVDWEHTEPLSKAVNQKILKFVKNNINSFNAVIIEDYGKGVINCGLVEEIINLARAKNKIITVDPKEEHFDCYCGVTSITPNRKELENAVRYLKIKDDKNKFRINTDKLFTDKEIDCAAEEIMEYLDLGSVLVTLGENGMKLFERGAKAVHIPTVAQEVFDVSGAGDTVIACFTMALSVGAKKEEAARLANLAGGIVVGKLGTANTTQKELLERLR